MLWLLIHPIEGRRWLKSLRKGKHWIGKHVTEFEDVAKRLSYKRRGERTYNLYTGGYHRAWV